MPECVFVQLAGLRRIISHAEQIIDGVLILLSAQPIMRHRRSRRHPRRTALLDPRIQTRHKHRDLLLRRPFFLLRRHLTRIDLLHHLSPVVRVCAEFKITREPVDPQVTLLLLWAMTANAMVLKEGVKRICGTNHLHETQAGRQEKRGGERRAKATTERLVSGTQSALVQLRELDEPTERWSACCEFAFMPMTGDRGQLGDLGHRCCPALVCPSSAQDLGVRQQVLREDSAIGDSEVPSILRPLGTRSDLWTDIRRRFAISATRYDRSAGRRFASRGVQGMFKLCPVHGSF